MDALKFPTQNLDVGCGNGRFTYGFLSMGASVIALDQSSNAVVETLDVISGFNSDSFSIFQHNILESLDIEKKFDLVWSYGVLHHTGNTYKAFLNLVPYVKRGGYLFLMLYGEPVLGDESSFQEQVEYLKLRKILKNKNYKDKISYLSEKKGVENIHGWFDAASPLINDTYSFEEIERWLIKAGFTDICKTSSSTNHHIIARKV